MNTGASPGPSPSTMSTEAGQEAISPWHMASSLPVSELQPLPRAIIWTLKAGNSLLSPLFRDAGSGLEKRHPALSPASASRSRDDNLSLSHLPQGPVTIGSCQEPFFIRVKGIAYSAIKSNNECVRCLSHHHHHGWLLLSASIPCLPFRGSEHQHSDLTSPELLHGKGVGRSKGAM